jgi:hypothetical protein
VLQLVDDRGFEVALRIAGAFIEPEEFEHIRIFDEVGGLLDDLALLGEGFDLVFVTTQGEALKEAAVDLALEFAQTPIVGRGLDFVEATLIGI